MYVLAIDPGNVTGVALVTEDAVVWAESYEVPREGHMVLGTIRGYENTPVVIEEAPTLHSHESHAYNQVLEIVRRHPNVTYVRPSAWKGHPSSRLTASDKAACKSKHEREAVGLGRRFLNLERDQ